VVNEKPKYIWSYPAAGVLPRLKHAESLDGLAESHVVRQAAAETDSLEEVDPTETDLLVFPQVALESGYGCYGPDRIEVLKRIPQLGEGAVQVEVRFGRQKRVEESRLRSAGSGRAAISRRMIRSGLSLVKPSPRFLGLRLFTSRTVSAGRRKKKEGRRKKEEERRKKEEGRRKKNWIDQYRNQACRNEIISTKEKKNSLDQAWTVDGSTRKRSNSDRAAATSSSSILSLNIVLKVFSSRGSFAL